MKHDYFLRRFIRQILQTADSSIFIKYIRLLESCLKRFFLEVREWERFCERLIETKGDLSLLSPQKHS